MKLFKKDLLANIFKPREVIFDSYYQSKGVESVFNLQCKLEPLILNSRLTVKQVGRPKCEVLEDICPFRLKAEFFNPLEVFNYFLMIHDMQYF